MEVQTNNTLVLAKSAKSFKRDGTDFNWWELTIEDGEDLLTLKTVESVFNQVEKMKPYPFLITIKNSKDVRITGVRK